VFNPRFRFLEVRAANVDDVTVERIAQKFRTGEWADERDLGRCGDGLACLRGRRSDRAEKSEDLVLTDRLVNCNDGLFGLLTVVN